MGVFEGTQEILAFSCDYCNAIFRCIDCLGKRLSCRTIYLHNFLDSIIWLGCLKPSQTLSHFKTFYIQSLIYIKIKLHIVFLFLCKKVTLWRFFVIFYTLHIVILFLCDSISPNP